MEEENSVFGADAKNTDKINTEENFNFYHKNKETAKKDIDKSAKELTDFIDSLSMDVPELSEEEINKGIEKILERTHPSERQSESVKNSKSKKVTFKVLFLVALLSIVSFSCLYVVGSSHNISIENGFVTFTKDTIKIVFFGKDNEEYITVDALLTDLELHGYRDILFPQEFVTNSDKYKVSVPKYSDDDVKQALFNFYNDSVVFKFAICRTDSSFRMLDYVDLNNAQTIDINGTYIYLFEMDNGEVTIDFEHGDYHYCIQADLPISDMVKIVDTIK